MLSFVFRDLTSRPHMAGLPEDRESAEVIEQRWINDGLKVTKPSYNILLSYPNDTNVNQIVSILKIVNHYSYLLE